MEEEISAFPGRQSGHDGHASREAQTQDEEADDAHGPAETQRGMIDDPVEHDRKNDAAQRGTGRGDSQGQRSPLMEVLSDDCNSRSIGEAVGETTKDALDEDELPVFLANAREHHRDDVDDGKWPNDNLLPSQNHKTSESPDDMFRLALGPQISVMGPEMMPAAN